MNLDTAIFYTNDIETAVAFYGDTLGLKLEAQNGSMYASFVFPNGAKLGLKKKDAEREVPGAQTVIFSIESGAEELFKTLQEKNVPIYKELSVQSWGKNFAILDPDMNKVEFVERPAT